MLISAQRRVPDGIRVVWVLFVFLIIVLLLKTSFLFCQSITFFNSPLVYGRIMCKKTLVSASLLHVLFLSSFFPLVSVFWEYYLVVQACLNSVNWEKSFFSLLQLTSKSHLFFNDSCFAVIYSGNIYICSNLSSTCIFVSVSWEVSFAILHFEMQLT